MGITRVAIAGSTGSIGTQTLDFVAQSEGQFEVVGLGVGSSVDEVIAQAKLWKPKVVAVANEDARKRVAEALPEVQVVAEQTALAEVADVVVAHHVVYNVQEIVPFINAMSSHARKRVVLEMPQHHPLSNLSDAWKYFWKLDRPENPTPQDLMNVLGEMGINAHLHLWDGKLRQERNLDDAVRFTRIRLCLPESREPEVRQFLENHPPSEIRPLATIWWDI